MLAEPREIQILQAEIDPNGESDLRVLIEKKFIKYLKIDQGVYPPEDISFGPKLAELLPDLPAGDWNLCHFSHNGTASGEISMTFGRHDFPSVARLWHSVAVEYLDLRIVCKLRSNVYEACLPKSEANIIIKFARFPWEIAYINSETSAYAWMKESCVAPRFLGHVREGSRIIGFMIEKITDCRHAEVVDLTLCQKVLAELHHMGILHGDVNRHNFLIQRERAIMVDFENAQRCSDTAILIEEQAKLVEELQSTSGKGGCIVGNYS